MRYCSLIVIVSLLSTTQHCYGQVVHQLRDMEQSNHPPQSIMVPDSDSQREKAREDLIAEMTVALDGRLNDAEVKAFLSPDAIQASRQRWIQMFQDNESLIYTAHQGSSKYLPFLLRHLPLMDINQSGLEFSHLYDNALWAFHIRGSYPWAMAWDEETYREYVVPHVVSDEPRRGNWRYDFQWLIEREIFTNISLNEPPSPQQVQKIAAAVNREIWTKFKGGEIIFAPNLTPEIMAPKDVIEKKKASCTGLSLLLIYALRSIGIPSRMAGVYSWNDDDGKSHPSVIQRRQLLEAAASTSTPPSSSSTPPTTKESSSVELHNHSWVEIFDGDHWVFTGAHEAPVEDPGFNQTWFYPSKTNLQIPHDPIFAIFASTYSNHSHVFPLTWNPSYQGVYSLDVTYCYQKGYPKGVEPQC